MKKIIRLGTRGSPLALVQAEEIRHQLLVAYPHMAAEIEVEIVPIRTEGDWKPEHKERRFIEMGSNKGLFTKEIEDALINNYVDMAVHSMKDVASQLPDNLEIAAITERNNPHDAFIGRKAHTLGELVPGSIIGTSSLRRQAQLLAQRPDLKIVPLRGNVETRLKKLENGLADATLLAVAGLARLGLESHISSIMSIQAMLPAAGQGALGIEVRRDDEDMLKFLAPLNHQNSSICVTAERAVMRAIDGSCHTPAGAYATVHSGQLSLEALIARADGTGLLRLSAQGNADDAEMIGEKLGHKLRATASADLFTS